jgi:hypothetical protein
MNRETDASVRRRRTMLKRALSVVVGGVVLAGLAGPVELALAQDINHPAPDEPAAVVVCPKVMADQNATIDTVIQLTNVEGTGVPQGESSPSPTDVHCFWVDSQCNEVDHGFALTHGQPTGWTALRGGFPLDQPSYQNGMPGVALDAQGRFTGELKCYVFDSSTDTPLPRNNLVAAATIYNHKPGQSLDVQSYECIGLRAVAEVGEGLFDDDVLCLGAPDDAGCEQEYVGCWGTLILDQRFDVDPKADGSDNTSLRTSLTVVPCTENLATQQSQFRILQMLVYNEFEQRFSLAHQFSCRLDSYLPDLTFAPVFSAAVQGTASGQTRIRDANGGGLLAIASEMRTDKAGDAGTAAYHLSGTGSSLQDTITVFPAPAR